MEKDDAIIVKSNEGIQKILISNLVVAEVIGRNVLYHLLSDKVIECTELFSSVCANLSKYGCFIKPHRSYIVNMQYVDTIGNRQMTLQTLSSVPVAQGKANNKLCIDIRNSYQTEPIFHQGIPVSKEQGLGFGTKSMVHIVEKHGGVCRFLVKDGWFIFQATT